MTWDPASISFASQSQVYLNIKADHLMDNQHLMEAVISAAVMSQGRREIIADASFFKDQERGRWAT